MERRHWRRLLHRRRWIHGNERELHIDGELPVTAEQKLLDRDPTPSNGQQLKSSVERSCSRRRYVPSRVALEGASGARCGRRMRMAMTADKCIEWRCRLDPFASVRAKVPAPRARAGQACGSFSLPLI